MPSLTAEPADVSAARAAIPLGEGSCRHRMRVVGYVRSGVGTRDDCDHPLRAVCRDCEAVDFWRCESYGCGPCGEAKKRRLARLIEDGSDRHLGNGLRAYFLTVTAPGTRAGHLRWYQGTRPTHRPVCTCDQHGMTMGRWNGQESACWNRLRTAMTRDRTVQFVGAVETQKRGMLHRHIVLFTDEPLVHSEVQALALAAGYGCVLDLEPLDSFGKVSRYLTKYVAKASGDRAQVPWSRWHVDRTTGEMQLRRRPTYRLWSSSRLWGITMKQIKAAQAAQARNRAMYLRELSDLLDETPESRSAAGAAPASQTGDPP